VLHGSLPIRVEIVSNEAHGDRLLLGASWELSAPVGQGEPLDIHYRLDANQVLSIQLVRTNRRDEVLDESIDNPLTNVVNPSTARLWIEEKEEALRLGEIEREDAPQALSDIAVKYAELGLCERALDYLARAMRLLGHPDAAMLNNVGIYAGRIGDWEREEAAYREAARLSQWYGSLFNLALSQWNRGKHSDAVESIDKALAINRNGPSLVLRGMLAQASGDQSTYQRCLTEAFSMLSGRRIDSLDKWELGWFVTCCDKLGDSTTASLAREETRKRLRGSEPARGSEGVLPPEGELPLVDNRLPVRIP
jgi:tetratricopeptide (TPR) repeat protein